MTPVYSIGNVGDNTTATKTISAASVAATRTYVRTRTGFDMRAMLPWAMP